MEVGLYLKINYDCVVLDNDVVGVFDLDKMTVFKTNRNYLSKAEKRGKIINTTESLPKSFVVCESCGEDTVYLSSFMPHTISNRRKF